MWVWPGHLFLLFSVLCAGRPVYWEETGLISTRFAELSTYFSVDDLVVQHVRMQELMRVRCEYSSKIHGRVSVVVVVL